METYKPTDAELIEVKKIKIAHKIYLLRLEQVLSNLCENNGAIFSRKPDARLKTTKSILKNYMKPENRGFEFIPFVRTLKDIAGLRLTITTKYEFDLAKRILSSSKYLQEYGVLDTESRKENGVRNKRGYAAHHYYIRWRLNLNSEDEQLKRIIEETFKDLRDINKSELNLEYDVIAEIQVRTLAQDLWAVFEHPERYKGSGEISKSLNEELFNYSSLMEVADDIAKLTKNRKIYEAEEYFRAKKKSPKKGQTLLNFEELQNTIEKYLEREDIIGSVSTYDFCILLTKLADNDIFTRENLVYFLDNKEYIDAVDSQFSIIGEIRKDLKIPILDNIEFLLYCQDCENDIDLLDENAENFSKKKEEAIQRRDSKIKNRILEVKSELDFQTILGKSDV